MSVLIRGMQLPRDCQFCKLAHWNTVNMLTGCDAVVGKRYADTHDLEFCTCDGRPSWCPLIEVPPHSILIDKMTVIKELHDTTFCDGDDRTIVYKVLENAPTIISPSEYENALKNLKNIPVEVIHNIKHGKWELAEDGWYCSVCGLYPPFDCDPEEKGIPYCPWCGARMDGGT